MKVLSSLAVAAVLALSNAAAAQAQLATEAPAATYKIDLTHTSVTFKVSHLGLSNYTGRFAKIDGTMTFDPAKPEASKLEVSIDPLSIRTDYPNVEKVNFDKELAESPKWFNAGTAKAITFKSTAVKMTGAKTADVTGDLTLLGVTKPTTLKVVFNGGMKEHPFAKKPAIGFSATGNVKRSDYGMTHLVPNIGDEVALIIESELFGG